MATVEEIKKRVSVWDAEVREAEAQAAPLKEELERAESQLQKRQKALAEAQAEAEQMRRDYQVECRKLACDEPSSAVELKSAIQGIEARTEGLKQLVAEGEHAVTAARAPLAEAESKLANARHEKKLASLLLSAEESLQRVGGGLVSLIEEVDRAQRAVEKLHIAKAYSTYIGGQAARLHRLEMELGRAKAEFL